jgi:hypothetical protein
LLVDINLSSATVRRADIGAKRARLKQSPLYERYVGLIDLASEKCAVELLP